jgi:hypothetical protein
VLVRPRRFFRRGVAPGDQAPGLVFGVCVALCHAAGLFALSPAAVPAVASSRPLSAAAALLAVGLLLAPATLHLVAAVATLTLRATVADRAGVSETVQLVAYAAAPCALAGPPVPALRLACAAYGAVLLVVGVAVVHRTSPARALLAGALPAALLFGYGFGGVEAAAALV